MKKILLSVGVGLILLMWFSLSNDAQAAAPTIYVDGKKVNSASITINGSTLVPLRTIAEKLGLEVRWDQSTQTVTFKHPYRTGIISHKIGTNTITLNTNGKTTKTLTAASVNQKGTSYVPIRLFEYLDAQVFWTSAQNRIDVYSYELKTSQYIMFAGLAYNDINHLVGSSVPTIVGKLNSNGKRGFYADLKNTQKYLGMYAKTSSGAKITPKTFIGSDYLHATEWKMIDALVNKDTGFQGYAFQNNRTKEVVISYRGSDDTADWYHNSRALTSNYNYQKLQAYALFERNAGKSDNITIVGHSLGGYLAQATAKNYPSNFNKVVTFNAFGIDQTNNLKNVINYRISNDPVANKQNHYGRSVGFNIRMYADDFTISAHKLFNFYSYFYPAKSKYWLNLDKKGLMPHNKAKSTANGNPYVW
ncbi:alpha/beta fold hydrolase [Bacillus sp. 31A1R]|uniref:Alpha/beta fold hydrolase n=1 Tax=Robertmurraya mangrovi TaxID=3098077 RepID=A0ABU5IXP0_9BACI|nr:alpha/beta fold hydrolase [Bacillus sp. 31A1R]MDZ5471891.1 alpha/beta fold hydrolase [Bacillus sp. 31A1R]